MAPTVSLHLVTIYKFYSTLIKFSGWSSGFVEVQLPKFDSRWEGTKEPAFVLGSEISRIFTVPLTRII